MHAVCPTKNHISKGCCSLCRSGALHRGDQILAVDDVRVDGTELTANDVASLLGGGLDGRGGVGVLRLEVLPAHCRHPGALCRVCKMGLGHFLMESVRASTLEFCLSPRHSSAVRPHPPEVALPVRVRAVGVQRAQGVPQLRQR